MTPRPIMEGIPRRSTQQTTKIVYSTVEEVRAALIARGLAAERVDLLLLGKVPQPVEVLGDVEKESF